MLPAAGNVTVCKMSPNNASWAWPELSPSIRYHHRALDCPRRKQARGLEYTPDALGKALAELRSQLERTSTELAALGPVVAHYRRERKCLWEAEGQLRLLAHLDSLGGRTLACAIPERLIGQIFPVLI